MVAYLHCELTARDLDSRLLIASYLLRSGEPVVVGQYWATIENLGHCPRGVSAFTTANVHQGKCMARCVDVGHPVVTMDEEVLALQDERLITEYTHPDAAQHTSLYCFQDARHTRLVNQKHPALNGRITGSARIELLRQHRNIYQPEATEYQRAGSYLLINTSFALANSAWGDVKKALSMALGSTEDEQTRERYKQTAAEEETNFDTLVKILGKLVPRLKKLRVIVRPHPAENAERWKDVPGLEVIVGSNALPWILGASLVIHTNSTTGFEAALMEVPCLNVGVPDERYVMDQINCSISSADAAAEAAEAFLRKQTGPIQSHKTMLDEYLPDGAKNIAAAIIEIGKSLPPAAPITNWLQFPRPEIQRRKYNVPLDLFLTRVNAICAPLVPARLDVTPLDDSLFMIRSVT